MTIWTTHLSPTGNSISWHTPEALDDILITLGFESNKFTITRYKYRASSLNTQHPLPQNWTAA